MRSRSLFNLFDLCTLVEGHSKLMGKYQPSYLLRAYDRMIRNGLCNAEENVLVAIENIETAYNAFKDAPRRPNHAA